MALPSPDRFRAMFRPMHELIDALGEPVTLRVRNAAGGFDDFPVLAKPSPFRTEELIPGGPAKLGDLRLIIRAGALPAGLRRLEGKDRVTWRGRDYAVVNWDDAGRTVAGEVMAVECWIRG